MAVISSGTWSSTLLLCCYGSTRVISLQLNQNCMLGNFGQKNIKGWFKTPLLLVLHDIILLFLAYNARYRIETSPELASCS